jgi:hypothetical protein
MIRIVPRIVQAKSYDIFQKITHVPMFHKSPSLKFCLSRVMATNINIIGHVRKYGGNINKIKIKI